MYPRTKPAIAPGDIPPEFIFNSLNNVEAFAEVIVTCDNRIVLARTATLNVNPSYKYTNARSKVLVAMNIEEALMADMLYDVIWIRTL
jgi:hypothetical protein